MRITSSSDDLACSECGQTLDTMIAFGNKETTTDIRGIKPRGPVICIHCIKRASEFYNKIFQVGENG